MSALTDSGVPFSMISPKYLHSNSTSHAKPFSAIAELIDNAYDPDVRAKQIWIDTFMLRGQPVLSFMDNGNGLTFDTMHKMLSFGFSDKRPVKDHKPIGMYGNGFKSGAMRLGRDAIVFSKSKSTTCVGLLSQTYLEDIQADTIVVPIVCFEQSGENENEFSVREDQQNSLEAILKYSPYRTQEELLHEIKIITALQSTIKTGTRIIIWNLRRNRISSEATELDFQRDCHDIQFPPDVPDSLDDAAQQPGRVSAHIPESTYSLRAYCSILYQKPRMQIILRGMKVTTQLIAKSLALTEKDFYKPAILDRRIPITFGYNTKSKHQYGIMMYHKNRLIKAYERVGCQLKTNYEGVGVIGIIECGDFLQPTHNKQDFNETDTYRKTMTNLGIKLDDYWKEIRSRRKEQNPQNTTPVEDTVKKPDQTWVQCDNVQCLKWRKVPDGFKVKPSQRWTCSLNPDPEFRSCSVEEEPEDSDAYQAGYTKTYKRQEKLEQKKQRETRQGTPSNAATSHTNVVRSESPQGGAAYSLRSSTPHPAEYSSPGSSSSPVIAPVSSPSTKPQRAKRTESVPQQTTPKRQKVTHASQGASNTSELMIVSPKHPSKGSTTQTGKEVLSQTEDRNLADQSSQNEDAEMHQNNEEEAEPSHASDTDLLLVQPLMSTLPITDFRDQLPDQIPEMIQRQDPFKDQVVEITNQLKHMQLRLHQLEETEDRHFSLLVEEADQKCNELIDLLGDIQNQRSTARAERDVVMWMMTA